MNAKPKATRSPVTVADEIQPWARRVAYTGSGLFGAANLIVSSVSIGTLAYTHLHLGIFRSVALAAALDFGALVAGALWVGATGGLRSWGRTAAIGLVGASVVGNASDVLATAGLVVPSLLIVLAVVLAVAAPVVSMVFGHLVLMTRAAVTASAAPVRVEVPVRRKVEPAPAVAVEKPRRLEAMEATVVEPPVEPAPKPRLAATPDTDVDLAAKAREVLDKAASDGKVVGRNRLAEALDIEPYRARKLLAELAASDQTSTGGAT